MTVVVLANPGPMIVAVSVYDVEHGGLATINSAKVQERLGSR